MISRFFIDRPIFATVLSIVITLIGGISLLVLPVAQYPRVTPPGVSISISYPGASAQEVADSVGAPIEQQVNGDLIGDMARERLPRPAEIVGVNAVLMLTAIAHALPAELSPQSRYQIAIDLTKAAMSGLLAEVLTRGG